MRLRDEFRPEINFRMVARERGKIVPGSIREGHNVATVTGREYYAQIGTYSDYVAKTPVRTDRIFYMGVGDGAQPEVASVDQLASAVEWDIGKYLKPISSAEFPNDPATSVVYLCEFLETDISIGAGGTQEIREAGLFTEISDDAATDNAPLAYKNFEPLVKTTQFRLEVRWEIRFR